MLESAFFKPQSSTQHSPAKPEKKKWPKKKKEGKKSEEDPDDSVEAYIENQMKLIEQEIRDRAQLWRERFEQSKPLQAKRLHSISRKDHFTGEVLINR